MPPVKMKEFFVNPIIKNINTIQEPLVYHIGKHFNFEWEFEVRPVPITSEDDELRRKSLDFTMSCKKTDTSEGTSPEWAIEGEYDIVFACNCGAEKVKTATCHFDESGYVARLCWMYWVEDNHVTFGEMNMKLRLKIQDKMMNFDGSDESVSDVVLKVQNEKFYVLKQYLAFHSPVFKAFLMGNFPDSEKKEIPIHDVDCYEFQLFLEAVYGGNPINEYTVIPILKIADYYDAQHIVARCEDFLLKTSEKPLDEKLLLALEYCLDELKDHCLADIKNPEDLYAILPENTYDLNKSALESIMQKSISLHATKRKNAQVEPNIPIVNQQGLHFIFSSPSLQLQNQVMGREYGPIVYHYPGGHIMHHWIPPMNQNRNRRGGNGRRRNNNQGAGGLNRYVFDYREGHREG